MRTQAVHANVLKGYKNAANIALIPEKMRQTVFGDRKHQHKKQLEELALAHLKDNGLYGKETSAVTEMPKIDFPRILGRDLDEHFSKIGTEMAQPYLDWCLDFTKTMVQQIEVQSKKTTLQKTSGWVRYDGSKPPHKVDFPRENIIVFDVEVLYKVSDYPVMATAASADAWYVWLSPWLLGEDPSPEHLVPLGSHQQVVVGHNVSYDRKRVKEEYNLVESDKFFLDTMSLHIATAGMCARQRPMYNKHRKQQNKSSDIEQELDEDGDMAKNNPWLDAGTLNGVKDVFAFNYPKSKLLIDKSQRDWFSSLEIADIRDNLDDLIKYCALDVYCTKRIFDKVLPEFVARCPHPVSFGALKPMGSLFLPINERWDQYLESSEGTYQAIRDSTSKTLTMLAEELCERGNDPEDPWVSQLDWTTKPPRYTKAGKLVKNQKFPGKPEWYRDLFPAKDKPMNLTLRTRITPILLKLQWDGNPLVYLPEGGWCFRCSTERKEHYLALNYNAVFTPLETDEFCYFKIPHKDGASAKCGNPMAKGYLSYFESGVLSAENKAAAEMLKENTQTSYWIASRERAFTQMPVYQSPALDMGYRKNDGHKNGMIIPRFVPMGTVTRRAVESMWLTASNAKSNRVGSELKSMVTAPQGYSFVGADVDSEELWIASVIGDSLFGLHGGTALGWMTLEGAKHNGTDLHSRTAKILNISRDQAKIFNYGRIYGAGETFAANLLKQFDPNISEAGASESAKALYKSTKGKKVRLKSGQFWRGGSESVAFNQLELMAQQGQQRTPILGAGITSALLSKNLTQKNGYLTSRINWSIQSSGVDYLHLLVASMYYLCKVYNIKARLMITIHDEIRYMAKDEDKYRCALALQISNLWTRAMFCQQLGMDDLPQGIAFFSAVDIDHVLRKEVNLPCVTPSNKTAIDPGQVLDISQLMEICNSLGAPNNEVSERIDRIPYTPRVPIMSQIRSETAKEHIHSLVAQVSTNRTTASKLLVELENSDEQWAPLLHCKRAYRM